MEKRRNIIQVYAIIVNVVAIITAIITATSLISALIDRGDPLYAGYLQQDLASFETYKMEVLSSTIRDAAYIPTDEQIKEMYEAAKTDKINRVMHESYRTMVVSGIILLFAGFLFAFHWWIARKYSRVE